METRGSRDVLRTWGGVSEWLSRRVRRFPLPSSRRHPATARRAQAKPRRGRPTGAPCSGESSVSRSPFKMWTRARHGCWLHLSPEAQVGAGQRIRKGARAPPRVSRGPDTRLPVWRRLVGCLILQSRDPQEISRLGRTSCGHTHQFFFSLLLFLKSTNFTFLHRI